ncbi:MAG TPA: helix-turn-helix domain-containing protein [Candidatus Limnocylindrales bacterium]|jgi:transcriptional regulator with XRE-family HTH domain|nr:helix-turn-helix domain-containing protein [Candidatus Limnocylindrales bacterium]
MGARRQHSIRVRDPAFVARLASRLRESRLAAGETQASLAEGWCTKAAISALESGKSLPSLDTLSQIADRTGVSIVSFLADEPDAPVSLSARIRGVEIDRGRVVAELTDGRIVGLPLRSIDGLLDASLRDLDGWRLAIGRRAIEWPALGLMVGLETFLGAEADAPQGHLGRPAKRVRRAATT